MEIPYAKHLVTDNLRTEALVGALGKFLSRYLSIRFPCTIHTYQSRSPRERQLYLKNGCELHELICEDNHYALQPSVEMCSFADRQKLDLMREKLDKFSHEASNFMRDYNVVLMYLERFCCTLNGDDCIKLKDIAAPDADGPPRSIAFFRAVRVEEGVYTGEFVVELRRLVENMVDGWVETCYSEIKQRFGLQVPSVHDTLEDTMLSNNCRKNLSSMIADQISMRGLFTPDMRRNPLPLNINMLSELCQDHLNTDVHQRCEQIRSDVISRLQVLQRFSKDLDVVALASHCVEYDTNVVSLLRTPPQVLIDRPGFAATELHLKSLASTVRRASCASSNVVVQLISQWRTRVGRSALTQLDIWVKESISIMENQQIPQTGFMPTLHYVRPPPPSWRTTEKTWSCGDGVYITMPKLLSSGLSHQYIPLPSAVHASLRLVSLVWELAGFQESHDAYFAPGEVRSSIVRDAIFSERVTLQNASIALTVMNQRMAPGSNYRQAALELREFRKFPRREVELRFAVQALSKFPLYELATMCFDGSVMYEQNESNIINATLKNMQRGPLDGHSWLVRRAFQTALPIICQLRREITLSPEVNVNPLGTALMSIPLLREWRGNSTEIVLTQEEVREGIVGLVDCLKKLSNKKTGLVYFGPLASYMRNSHQHLQRRSVFRINGSVFRNLFG